MKASIPLEKVFVSLEQLATALLSLTEEEKEALSILLDKQTMEEIAQSGEDIEAGNLVPIEQWERD